MIIRFGKSHGIYAINNPNRPEANALNAQSAFAYRKPLSQPTTVT